METTEIKNRFEIRLKNERAYHAVADMLTYYDVERTAFSIINHYVRFVDRENGKPKSKWKLNADWAWFIGEHREKNKADYTARAVHSAKGVELATQTSRSRH